MSRTKKAVFKKVPGATNMFELIGLSNTTQLLSQDDDGMRVGDKCGGGFALDAVMNLNFNVEIRIEA